MTIYTVQAPTRRADGPDPDPAAFLFIKDGFCWPALFFPIIWLIVRGLWLVLLLYLAGLVLIVGLETAVGGGIPFAIFALASFLFALEANGLRRWTAERQGLSVIGVVSAGRIPEAEARFFEDGPIVLPLAKPSADSTPSPPASPPTASSAPPAPRPASAEHGEVIGLFPLPERSR